MIDELIETIGPTAARKLVARYGNKKIHVPSQGTFDRQRRNRRIVKALEAQVYRAVARREGLHPQTVKSIAKRGTRT